MDLSKEELIRKLEAISALYNRTLAIKIKMNNFMPEDNYEREVVVPIFSEFFEGEENFAELEDLVNHADDNAIEQMGSVYDRRYHPQTPVEPKKPPYEESANIRASREKQRKFRIAKNIGLGVCIFFVLGAIFGTSDSLDVLPTILIIAALGATAFVVGKFLIKKEKEIENELEAENRAQYDIMIAALNEEYENAIKLYKDECSAYTLIRQAFLEKYAVWRKIYLDSLIEEGRINATLENNRQAAVEKIQAEELVPVLNDLENLNDLISTDYLPTIDMIIELLKSGRADTLKEAINLYEEILYREKQLEQEEQRLQEEERHHREEMQFLENQERQRQHEEAQRRSDEAQRHREEMQFLENQERQRQREAEQLRSDAERRHRENIAQQDRQTHEASMSARSQCVHCANYGTCTLRYTPPINCGGFRPR